MTICIDTQPNPPITLEWGLMTSPPLAASVAWGARALYTITTRTTNKRTGRVRMTASIGLLWDRMCAAGGTSADRKVLTDWLTKTGIPALERECARQYLTADSSNTIEFTEDDFTVMASPKRSYGYLYITAWRNPS